MDNQPPLTSKGGIKKFASDIFKETGTDKYSSKRFIVMVGVALLIIAFVANMFFQFHLDQPILDAISGVVYFGLGTTGLEKFSKFLPSSVTSKLTGGEGG